MNFFQSVASTLEFPKLGLKFNLDPVAFRVFGIDISWYAIIIVTGMCLGWILACRRARTYGMHSEQMFDIMFLGLLAGAVGARVYYVVFNFGEFRNDLLGIFNIRQGGLAIYGGIIGGVLAGFIYTKVKKIEFLPATDVVAPLLLLGQGIGRWGNFVNQEAYGRNTNSIFGMTSKKIVAELSYLQKLPGGEMIDPSLPVHPCFFYESVWCLLGFVVLSFFAKKRKFDGEVLCWYMIWYGAGRFFIEGLRTDSLYIGNTGLRVSQVLALVTAVLGLGIVLYHRVRIHQEKEISSLFVDSEKSKTMLSDLDEKFAKTK